MKTSYKPVGEFKGKVKVNSLLELIKHAEKKLHKQYLLELDPWGISRN